MKLAASEPAANINALLTKTGNWASSGEINLTAGKSIEAHGIAFNSGKSLTFNAGQDILLGLKAIKDVDNVFKTNRYPELRSQLIANGNITLNAARDIDLQSANLQSTDKIIVLSGRDTKLTATAYSAIPNPNEDNQDVRYVTSTLSGDKGVTLASNGALTAQGSTIKSLNDITLSSGGNVRLESVKTNYRKQSGKTYEELYRQIGTEINSGKTLTILSEGSILFQASRLIAKGAMDIAAKGGYLYAQAMEESSYFEEYKKKCNRWTLCITKKEVRKTRSDKTNKVTEFTAGGDINLYAKDDVTLEATKINTGKNAKITSQTGKVNFKAVKNSQFEQVITNSNGFYITQRNKGYTSDKWILPSLHIGGKLTVDANKGITADVKTKEGQSFEQALAILSRTPGYEWLGDVKNNKNINWAVVKDAYSQWDIKTESLNPVVGAVIAIAVAAATYGTSTAAGFKVVANSEEALKSLKNAIPTTSKELLTSGKLNTSKLIPIIEKEQLHASATNKLVAEINRLPSKTQAANTATMIGAYDPVTGKIAIGYSDGKISAEMLNKDTVIYVEKKLGVKIAEYTTFCKNKVGACAEVSAADSLIRQGVKPENIRFTQAVRPREVWGKDTISLKAIKETCDNCLVTWPTGVDR
ncbi:hemagglutinin repeat-containing protein [Providencia rettgeri]|uniref:hemagglutinin repeat-containing protein n=1 Tax=Providencia rettgeri TaxID=587 RepID=UPI001FFB33DC|nr:hemagglutinin repeat-containing protein [Providencia rettgeri]